MNVQKKRVTKAGFMLCLCALISACSTEVTVTHSPIVATVDDTITFEAKGDFGSTPDSVEIEIVVDSVVIATCQSSPCTVTAGPFPSQAGNILSYSANLTADYSFLLFSNSDSVSDGEYETGIADTDFTWNGRTYIPARVSAPLGTPNSDIYFKEDLVLHMAKDYDEDFDLFFSHVEDKVYDVLGGQTLIDEAMDKFNFWVYTREARNSRNCGKPHRRADNDMPWADTNGVLHIENFGDCTNVGLDRFSAEGSNTRAFLHELGHATFGLGDEYDGDTNYSIVESPEPNIFATEVECRAQQISKSRDPDDCYMFTARQGDWWGTHTGTTVMQDGLSGQAWGTEASERVELFLSTIP